MTAKMPVFPAAFYKHCPKVLEAKDWYKRLAPNEEFVKEDHAECAFHNAGAGMECENCRMFLTRPFLGHKVDEQFLPLIEQFYRDLEVYEKARMDEAIAEATPPRLEANLDMDELLGTIVALRWFRNTPTMHEQVSLKVRAKTFKFLDQLERVWLTSDLGTSLM